MLEYGQNLTNFWEHDDDLSDSFRGWQYLKNGVFWDVTPRGSSKNQRFGGI
jgi:hypothetical protein